MNAKLGVYSEVGILREVLVHRPDLSLTRLTPGNCHDLLFDDVIWVKEARQEHDAFVDAMRSGYLADTGITPEIYTSRASDGAHRIAHP